MRDKTAHERDTRISRALRDVVPHYDITRFDPADQADKVRFRVKSRSPGKTLSDYTVIVSREWASPPACTCPDGSGRARLGGYCKHAIAVLAQNDEFSCQLIELFLRD
ncbi:MAG: SWIM zinc finger family protein [Planctomycetota bacterium]